MSYITSVTLLDIYEGDLERLNAWLAEHDERKQTIRFVAGMDQYATGGNAGYYTAVAAAALNYMPHRFVDLLNDPKTWRYPCIWALDTEEGHKTVGIVTFSGNGCKVQSISGQDD